VILDEFFDLFDRWLPVSSKLRLSSKTLSIRGATKIGNALTHFLAMDIAKI
jgi:hypothetical protein